MPENCHSRYVLLCSLTFHSSLFNMDFGPFSGSFLRFSRFSRSEFLKLSYRNNFILNSCSLFKRKEPISREVVKDIRLQNIGWAEFILLFSHLLFLSVADNAITRSLPSSKSKLARTYIHVHTKDFLSRLIVRWSIVRYKRCTNRHWTSPLLFRFLPKRNKLAGCKIPESSLVPFAR